MNLPLNIFSTTITVLTGLVIYAFYASCDPRTTGEISTDDEILPYFVIEVLGKFHGIPGVFVAALFCGTLSTVASGLNALAAVTVEDFAPMVVQHIPTEREALVSKLLVCIYGLISLALAFVVSKLGMILQMSATMFGTTGGPMLGLFSLGILTTRANSKGVWIGVAAGFWTVTWISIGALIHPPQYPTQPMSVSGCPSNVTNFNMSSIQPAPSIAPHSVYALSFFWYGILGFLITYIIGYLASFIFTKHEAERIDPALLFDYSKFCSWCNGSSRRQSLSDVQSSTESDEHTPFMKDQECNIQS